MVRPSGPAYFFAAVVALSLPFALWLGIAAWNDDVEVLCCRGGARPPTNAGSPVHGAAAVALIAIAVSVSVVRAVMLLTPRVVVTDESVVLRSALGTRRTFPRGEVVDVVLGTRVHRFRLVDRSTLVPTLVGIDGSALQLHFLETSEQFAAEQRLARVKAALSAHAAPRSGPTR